MGIETILFVAALIVVLAVWVGVRKAKRKAAIAATRDLQASPPAASPPRTR